MRKYRAAIEALFKHRSISLRCAPEAQPRVRKMLILEKHIYEREREPAYRSEYLMRFTLRPEESLMILKLHKIVATDAFIREVLAPPVSVDELFDPIDLQSNEASK